MCNIGNVVNHKNKACKRNCCTAIEESTSRIVSHGPAKANCSLRLSIVTVFLHVHVYVYVYASPTRSKLALIYPCRSRSSKATAMSRGTLPFACARVTLTVPKTQLFLCFRCFLSCDTLSRKRERADRAVRVLPHSLKRLLHMYNGGSDWNGARSEIRKHQA